MEGIYRQVKWTPFLDFGEKKIIRWIKERLRGIRV